MHVRESRNIFPLSNCKNLLVDKQEGSLSTKSCSTFSPASDHMQLEICFFIYGNKPRLFAHFRSGLNIHWCMFKAKRAAKWYQDNCLAVPFNWISCQVFPEAITLLCIRGCLLASKPLNFPSDIMSEPVGLRGQPNAWQHSRVNSTTPWRSQEAGACWRRIAPTHRRAFILIQTSVESSQRHYIYACVSVVPQMYTTIMLLTSSALSNIHLLSLFFSFKHSLFDLHVSQPQLLSLY